MTSSQLKSLFEDYLQFCRFYRRLRNATLNNYENQMKVFFSCMPEVNSVSDLTINNMVEFFKRLEVRKEEWGKVILYLG